MLRATNPIFWNCSTRFPRRRILSTIVIENMCETNILRIATYELENHPEIPYRVVINEAVNLAKVYGAEDSHKFVNGVLDPLCQELRKLEVAGQ